MTSTPSIAIFVLLIIIGSYAIAIKSSSNPIVHEGQCPSNELLHHILCRRRVCLPQELISLCNEDGECPTTHKCCRPLCTCSDRCVEAVFD